MTRRNVIVELKYNKGLAENAFAATAAPSEGTGLETGTVPKVQGVSFDKEFAPCAVPGVQATTAMDAPYISGEKFSLATDAKDSTYVIRAEVEESKVSKLEQSSAVVGVYSDVAIEPMIICPGSPPMGNDADVERLLCTERLRSKNMDGSGVLLAVVDSGINEAYLSSRRPITLDRARSWVPRAGQIPGEAPVDHGTMVAFDAAIAAPKATFLDIQLLRSSAGTLDGLLSDAVRAYSHLLGVMQAPRRPGDHRSLVVNNSWGMFHPSWDFPVGHPGNYSDNPNHPFNRIVASLERLGADILFAAGNCGADCADGRCGGVVTNAIYGANGHPSVLTVAGVDVSKSRVGYSTQGPGRLSRNKPDISAYTHFKGSGVYAADGGTSAATPVLAGVVAAIRSRRPYVPGNPAASPAAIRALVRTTAEDLGTAGYDFDHGFGVVDGCKLADRFGPSLPPIDDICRRFPWFCRFRQLCERFPHLCRFRASGAAGAAGPDFDISEEELEAIEMALSATEDYHDQRKGSDSEKSGDCRCGGSK